MSEDRQAWLETRRSGIGGSDVAPMLGLSKWKTPYQLWQDKRGELPEQEDNEAMYWGRELEPVVRRRYELETELTVIHDEGLIRHKDYDFILANLDGRVENEEIILEIKTARYADEWGEVGTAEIPIAYSLQCQWYMMVTGYTAADVAVLISGSDFRLYRVEQDLELQEILLNAAIEFWDRVQTGVPPDITTYSDTVERYGESEGAGSILATEEVFKAHEDLIKIRRSIKTLEEMEDINKAIITKYMADNYDTILGPEGKPIATWKLSKGRAVFDSKRFQTEHADLYSQYKTEGTPSRKLLIK